MRVNIEKKLYLEADSNQFILKDYTGKIDSQGREGYTIVGYYAHLDQVITTLKTRKIKKSTAKDLKEFAKEVSELEAYVATLCSTIEINYKDLVIQKEQ